MEGDTAGSQWAQPSGIIKKTIMLFHSLHREIDGECSSCSPVKPSVNLVLFECFTADLSGVLLHTIYLLYVENNILCGNCYF